MGVYYTGNSECVSNEIILSRALIMMNNKTLCDLYKKKSGLGARMFHAEPSSELWGNACVRVFFLHLLDLDFISGLF